MKEIQFNCHRGSGVDVVSICVERLVIAGWTGRDQVAMEEHIAELAKLGVSRPASTPMFYELAPTLLTQGSTLAVVGRDATGEVECFFARSGKSTWVGVGSDHTDRKLETQSVTLSKQVCGKPISKEVWDFDECAGHFDSLVLRSWSINGRSRTLYQEGPASTMRRPEELFRLWPDSTSPNNVVMFGGTLSVKGQIGFASEFEMELHDPVLNRSLRHRYAINALAPAG